MRSVVLALVLAGCAPAPRVASELGTVPAGSARVCVVRPEEAASHVTMKLRDNGRLVGATRGRTYACWLAAPGAHQITSDADDTGPTLLRVEAGARYFLHLEVSELGGAAHAHLDVVDERAAEELVDACDARVLVSVPGHDDATGAMPIAPARL